MVHESRKVLAVLPKIVDFFRGAVYVDTLAGPDRSASPHTVGQLLAAKEIERRDAGDSRCYRGEPAARAVRNYEREPQQRKIDRIAADPRPQPGGGSECRCRW
jgi:hypothetical protein